MSWSEKLQGIAGTFVDLENKPDSQKTIPAAPIQSPALPPPAAIPLGPLVADSTVVALRARLTQNPALDAFRKIEKSLVDKIGDERQRWDVAFTVASGQGVTDSELRAAVEKQSQDLATVVSGFSAECAKSIQETTTSSDSLIAEAVKRQKSLQAQLAEVQATVNDLIDGKNKSLNDIKQRSERFNEAARAVGLELESQRNKLASYLGGGKNA